MAITAHKLGPGNLTFGPTGSSKEFGVQCTKVALEPKVDDGDEIYVLSGDSLIDDSKESYTLTGSIFQEFTMDSLIVWAKTNSGEILDYVFVPDRTGSLKITGKVKIKPVTIGGDVRKRNQSDFEFTGVGDWTPDTYAPIPVGGGGD